MKVLLITTILLPAILADNVKRNPFGGIGGTFSSFKGPSFFSTSGVSSSSSYPAPPPASYPAPAPATYSKPAPSYPKPSYPKPSYGHKAQETHNCSIQEEKATVSVCVPTLGAPECSPVTLKGVEVVEKEKCLSITRTVCTEGEEEVTVDVCTITYSPAPVQAEATLVEVTFKKECSKQMVTVCQPQSGYQSHGYGDYNKGTYQHCKEIAQETCYNKPSAGPKPEQVTLMVPTPNQDCGPQQITIPTVQCEDITEERCVQLPAIEGTDIEAEQCTVPLGEPSCNQMDLTLPLQVCRELLYGDAHKAEPVYKPAPPPSGYNA